MSLSFRKPLNEAHPKYSKPFGKLEMSKLYPIFLAQAFTGDACFQIRLAGRLGSVMSLLQ